MVRVMTAFLPGRANNPTTASGWFRHDLPAGGNVGPLLLGWCAVAAGIAAGDGRGPWPLALVLAGWGAVLVSVGNVVVGNMVGKDARAGRGAVWVTLAVVLAAGVTMRPRYYAAGGWADVSDALGVAGGLLTAGSILWWLRRVPGDRAGARWLVSPSCFWSVVGLMTGAGIAMILAAPRPRIDVFYLLQVSADGLFAGADMYRQQWAPSHTGYPVNQLFDVYPYLPGTTLVLAPFRLLLTDVRYGLLLASVITAVAIRRIMARNGALGDTGLPPALPLLVLAFPGSMYALQQSWTEPLLTACVSVMVWAVAAGRARWAVVAFAVALASKQHLALLIPVAAFWPAFGPRRTLASVAVAAAAVLPWVAVGPADFWRDAVMTNLRYPVRGDALSVPGVLSHVGVTTGFGPVAAALVLAYWLAWRVRADAAGFCAGAGVVLLTLDVMNKQSYFNHYTLPMALLVTALAAQGERGPTAPAAPVQRNVEKRSSAAPS